MKSGVKSYFSDLTPDFFSWTDKPVSVFKIFWKALCILIDF